MFGVFALKNILLDFGLLTHRC